MNPFDSPIPFSLGSAGQSSKPDMHISLLTFSVYRFSFSLSTKKETKKVNMGQTFLTTVSVHSLLSISASKSLRYFTCFPINGVYHIYASTD